MNISPGPANKPMYTLNTKFSRAFTAVELAVVIAGLSIPAMLLPTLGKAKAQANRYKCANNLKMITQATHFFASDHGGFSPWHMEGLSTSDPQGERIARALGAIEVSDVYNVETLWRLHGFRDSLYSPKALCSPCDPAAQARLEKHPVKSFDGYQGRSDFIVPRQIQSYAIHMGGDLLVGETILAMTRNFDGDDAVPTKNPSGDTVTPKFGRSLRAKNLKHAHFIGADEASHSRVMGGLNTGEGNWVMADGSVTQGSDPELHQAIREHSRSWHGGSSIALDENLSRPRQ
ncbi:MAG: type II secretion system protein [Limisphaerales bacterium]